MPIIASKKTQQIIELITGLIVIFLFIMTIVLAMIGHGGQSDNGYNLNASFEHIDGLTIGSDVKLAGVAVGQVVEQTVDPKTYKATVTFSMRPDIKLPTDSTAVITSDSLLGGKYIDIAPGGSEKILKPDQSIIYTQGSISLQELLSKFIFSMTDNASKPKSASPTDDKGKVDSQPGTGSNPAGLPPLSDKLE